SAHRTVDGAGVWEITSTPTPGATNAPVVMCAVTIVGQEDFCGSTIQEAINIAGENQIIQVASGTYAPFATSFDGPANVVIEAADGGSSIIEGNPAGRIVDLRANGTVIRGFTIRSTADGQNVGVSVSGQ